jgi:protein TonB
MFDKLVESGQRTEGARTANYFVVATAFYVSLLMALATGAVMWFNPALAEALEITSRLQQPAPLDRNAYVMNVRPLSIVGAVPLFTAPRHPPDSVETRVDLPDSPIRIDIGPGPLTIPGAGGGDVGRPDGIGPNSPSAQPPPPPPPPTAHEVIGQTAEPVRRSEGVLRGNAITNFVPSYPEIARRSRISGAVQIQVTISEEGRVIEAIVLNGNPFLRQAALDAARRWVFTPTRLSGAPVKVQGILTFNFVLN